MKRILCIFLSLLLALGIAGCDNTLDKTSASGSSTSRVVPQAVSSVAKLSPAPETATSSETIEANDMIGVTLQVGSDIFSATLINSEATRAFTQYFPMTVQMADLNGQEKYYDLASDLPANSSERPPTIYNGDIMCWSGNTLVLFYTTFSNSYDGYVRLGTVDDPDGLAAMLGTGSVEVTWTLAK